MWLPLGALDEPYTTSTSATAGRAQEDADRIDEAADFYQANDFDGYADDYAMPEETADHEEEAQQVPQTQQTQEGGEEMDEPLGEAPATLADPLADDEMDLQSEGGLLDNLPEFADEQDMSYKDMLVTLPKMTRK